MVISTNILILWQAEKNLAYLQLGRCNLGHEMHSVTPVVVEAVAPVHLDQFHLFRRLANCEHRYGLKGQVKSLLQSLMVEIPDYQSSRFSASRTSDGRVCKYS